jgi:ADP-heptose:LPS heptosyltransferase
MDRSEEYKILIVRLSSFGDIIQGMSVLAPLKKQFSTAPIHWVARSDMAPLLEMTNLIDQSWSYDRKSGLRGLFQLGFQLRAEGFTHIYDAHSNLRSFILKLILWSPGRKIITRSKERLKRFLLFQCRVNTFDWPYQGMKSFVKPLKTWFVLSESLQIKFNFSKPEINKVSNFESSKKISLVPSAAWKMKRWPIGHWKRLIELLPEYEFIVLGGPGDDFCSELQALAPERVINTAGQLSLRESCLVVQDSLLVISADTGLLHVADLTGTPCLALIGPTAFGFPTHSNVEVMQKDMQCRPCTKDGRGSCSQRIYQQCMVDISAQEVADKIRTMLSR